MKRPELRRGFILIIVVGILGVLAYLGLSLVQQASMHRGLSLHGLEKAKARLGARSGLEKAVVSLRSQGWMPTGIPGFERILASAGDDLNRDGADSGGEDLAGDGFSMISRLEDDLTPSLALAEDPLSAVPRSRILQIEGRPTGTSWLDDRANPGVMAKVGLALGCLDLNGGVISGEGAEGARYQADFGVVYSAADPAHPFNERTRLLLNAWGNYHKYRAMVRPGRTYDYGLAPDHPSNMMSGVVGSPTGYGNPFGRFDRFDSSRELHVAATERPLGDRLVEARPAGGFKNLLEPLRILEEYVSQWSDASGVVQPGWTRADGSVIGGISPVLRAEMTGEFSRIAQLNPSRRGEVLAIAGNDIPPLHPNDVAGNEFHNSYFERPEGRSYLNMRFYTVQSASNDVNTAPLSVLAALCQAVRGVEYREYWPNTRDGTTDFCRARKLRAPKENSHHLSPADPVAGDALYSMTDAIRLAMHLDALRRTGPIVSLKDLGNAIRQWDGAYDGRGQVFDARTRSSVWFPEYMDPYMGNARGYVLAYLLNHHVNSNHLVWDEAQVPSWNQGILSLGRSQNAEYGYRDFSYKNIFDRFMPHKTGGSLGVGSEHHQIQVLGFSLSGNGRILARSRIDVGVQSFRILDIHVQRDLVRATTLPGANVTTLGTHWVTYPELPGVPPAVWDGQLALRPVICDFSDIGENKTLSVTLNGYGPAPTLTDPVGHWPAGPRNLVGPGADPARGRFMNSLKPEPNQPLTSLVAGSYAGIEAASDLMPGGGIRVSPYNNTLSLGQNGAGGSFKNRREALLVLKNVLTDLGDDGPSEGIDLTAYSRALPSFHEGAVSFYFKPRFTCSKEAAGVGSGNRTLLTIPFVIFDRETEIAGETLNPTPLVQPEPYIRSWYTALLRLCWGANENPISGRLDDVPLHWPWVAPYRNYSGQVSTEPHLFPSMRGLEDGNGLRGYLMQPNMPDDFAGTFFSGAWIPGGDGRAWHWSAPHPYAEERLQLEFIIAKYADVPFNTVTPGLHHIENLNPTFDIQSGGPTSGFNYEDEMTTTATSGSYFNPDSTALHIFDNSNLSEIIGYHTVRKTFILCHPYVIDHGAGHGTGPRDSMGNHQALVPPGRWNHFFVAWRNLYDLLNNSDPNQGGCLAVYINGTYRKTSPMGFTMAGLFCQQDFSELYPEDPGQGPTSPWFPSLQDPYETTYSYGSYPQQYYGLPQLTAMPGERANGLHQQVPPLHYLTPDGNYLHNYDYCRYSVREFSARNEPLYMRFPPRFYFGFAPFTQKYYSAPGVPAEDAPYAAGSLCWGAFMNIQFYERPNPGICDSNGGFYETLPNWEDFSPYANNTTGSPMNMYPLNLLTSLELSQSWKVAGVSWNAHLPEFHEFWDDQHAVAPGPSALDSQELTGRIFIGGVAGGVLKESQDPATTGLLRHWSAPAPQQVASASDLRLEVGFRGPEVTMSTPIIESVEVALMPAGTKYLSYSIE